MRSRPYTEPPAAQRAASIASVTIAVDENGAPKGLFINGPMGLVELLRGPAEAAVRTLDSTLRLQRARAS